MQPPVSKPTAGKRIEREGADGFEDHPEVYRPSRSQSFRPKTRLQTWQLCITIGLARFREERAPVKRRRGPTYSAAAVRVLERVWVAAGYPWSERLKAMLPLWLPWAREHAPGCTPELEEQLLRMSARQMDRRLSDKKARLKKRIYGRTKPGTLRKHHIKTDNWDVSEPGFCEIDLVAHCGPSASGQFIYSLNLADIHSGWSETRKTHGRHISRNMLDEDRAFGKQST